MPLFDRLQTKACGLPKHIIPGTTVKRHMAAGLKTTGNSLAREGPGFLIRPLQCTLPEAPNFGRRA